MEPINSCAWLPTTVMLAAYRSLESLLLPGAVPKLPRDEIVRMMNKIWLSMVRSTAAGGCRVVAC